MCVPRAVQLVAQVGIFILQTQHSVFWEPHASTQTPMHVNKFNKQLVDDLWVADPVMGRMSSLSPVHEVYEAGGLPISICRPLNDDGFQAQIARSFIGIALPYLVLRRRRARCPAGSQLRREGRSLCRGYAPVRYDSHVRMTPSTGTTQEDMHPPN